jgi:hypothetical protein
LESLLDLEFDVEHDDPEGNWEGIIREPLFEERPDRAKRRFMGFG